MRSSESTHSRSPSHRIPLLIVLADEDHPRACTGRRLVRGGFARSLDVAGGAPRGAVILDPHAAIPLSRADTSRASTGVVAVDCSWNAFERRGRFPGRWQPDARSRRRLPLLLAGNAQHYARLGELNTAEALAAAVYLLESAGRAESILDGAGLGRSFLELNAEPLAGYRAAHDAAGILATERSFF